MNTMKLVIASLQESQMKLDAAIMYCPTGKNREVITEISMLLLLTIEDIKSGKPRTLNEIIEENKKRDNPIPVGYTASVEMNNGQIVEIWYTCYHSIKHQIKRIIKIYQ